MNRLLKVLIVDDSIVFRKAVEAALADETDVQVIGSVRNGMKAMEFIKTNPPDVVTLDMEMPDMDGLATLKAIQQFNDARPDAEPLRVIMLSVHTKRGADATMEALAAGAFDFVEKPEGASGAESLAVLRHSLVEKFHSIPGRKKAHATPVNVAEPAKSKQVRAIAIGVSTGGPKALNDMLPELCRLVKLPILIVQHMPPGFTKSLAKQLDAKCCSTVVEASDGAVVKEGFVYIAPGGCHTTVKRVGVEIRIALNNDPPENACRPAVDVLFRSVAEIYGGSVVAAILTGMGSDGAKACRALRNAGARIVVQDEATSVVWGMPGSAVATGLVERVEPLLGIPQALKELCGV